MSVATKSNGRKELEEAIVNKIQSIFDNAESILRFKMEIKGAYDEMTTISYSVEERIIPNSELKGENK